MNKENSFFSVFTKKEPNNQQFQQFFIKELDNIQKYQQCLELLMSNISNQKQKCQNNLEKLEKQLESLQKSNFQLKKNANITENANQLKQQLHQIHIQLMKKTKQRIELAEKISIKKFKKLSLDDRKSKANEIFKWILVCFYDQPQSKYYWPNFKVQCFENDNGFDFKQRIGKISALKAKEQQKIKTDYFIKNFEQIKDQKQLKHVNEDMDILFKIAELFRESLLLAHQQANKKSQLSSTFLQKQEIIVKLDQEQARIEAYQDRINLSKTYLNTLKNYETQFTSKINQYKNKISCYSQESNVTQSKLPFKVIDNLQQKQSGGECSIY